MYSSRIWRRFIRLGFRLLYNEMAWTYGVVSWLVSLGDWREWQRAALPLVEGQDVLEIGYGPGHMLLALAEGGYRVVGLDLSPYMGRQATRRLKQAGYAIPLVCGDVAELPLANASFDTVLATFPTDYIMDSAVLTGVNRVLRGDGRFLIIPGAVFTGPNFSHRFIEWLYAITGQREGAFSIDEAQHLPTDSAWQTIQQRFAEAGFDVEKEQVHLSRSSVTRLIAHKRIGSTPLPLVQS